MPRVLAFDIGIKNLAWCCLEKSSEGEEESYNILGWDNYNLLSDESNVGASKGTKCPQCNSKGVYISGETLFCSRHCPSATPALRDISGNLLKKIPQVEVCRTLLASRGLAVIPKKKAQVIDELAKLYSLPSQTKKVSKAPDANLTEIHNSIQKLVTQYKTLWGSCNLILLENQPAFKNPTMKSVQILLFATIRDILSQPPPPMKLVHAGKKVQGMTKGDAGYKDRKAGSELRAETFLKDPKLKEAAQWQGLWSKATKKSDLADALAMCIDA